MAKPSSYSDEDNATIVQMRANGHGWAVIGYALGRRAESIRDHAHRTRLVQRQHPVVTTESPAVSHDNSHGPMPAFHPTSWNAIWQGHSWIP